MMQVAIFNKDLHEMELKNLGMEEYVGEYNWVYIADGHEVVFENSVDSLGTMTLVSDSGNLVNLVIRREWCTDFKPLM